MGRLKRMADGQWTISHLEEEAGRICCPLNAIAITIATATDDNWGIKNNKALQDTNRLPRLSPANDTRSLSLPKAEEQSNLFVYLPHERTRGAAKG